MTRSWRAVGLCAVAAIAIIGGGTGEAQTPEAPQIQTVLTAIKAQDKGQLAVSEEDGRFLRVLIATSKAKRALEIGAAGAAPWALGRVRSLLAR